MKLLIIHSSRSEPDNFSSDIYTIPPPFSTSQPISYNITVPIYTGLAFSTTHVPQKSLSLLNSSTLSNPLSLNTHRLSLLIFVPP